MIVILLGLVWLVMRGMKVTVKHPRRRVSDYIPELDELGMEDRTETMFDRREQ